MTDKPILFNAAMVNAVWADLKHQTRRVLKNAPDTDYLFDGFYHNPIDDRQHMRWMINLAGMDCYFTDRSPYEVGDRLWVKEAHFAYGYWTTTNELTRGGKPKRAFIRDWDVPVNFTEPTSALGEVSVDHQERWYKRNSLFMHKCDSRLTLPITDVRIQNVQEINSADAMSEGVDLDMQCCGNMDIAYDLSEHGEPINPRQGECCGNPVLGSDPRDAFIDLWDSINKPRGYGWDENPWVSASTFETHKCNIDQMEARP